MSEETGRLHTLADVARLCQVHPSTVRRWVRAGELQVVRIGGTQRVTPAELGRVLYQRDEDGARSPSERRQAPNAENEG